MEVSGFIHVYFNMCNFSRRRGAVWFVGYVVVVVVIVVVFMLLTRDVL